jgi:exopolyphosphatase/guanosine-5'-triphosphate,3'-diphosphate pyrophosphatase
MVFAAIDIGSNAMRLLFCRVYVVDGKAHFNKEELFRMPIRLGEDVFTIGKISEQKSEKLITALKGYAQLIKAYDVKNYRAVATSAMRDAANGNELISKIKTETGLNVEIIDGKKEAAIIASSDLHHFIKTNENYLYVDVGGGSTEFSLFSDGKMLVSKSFKNGTVRMLNNMVNEVVWQEIEKWIKTNTEGLKNITMIGSGGNINKAFKLSGKTQDKPLTYKYLKSQFDHINALTYEQRISELGLNTDRADVIIPALSIYLSAMRWSGANHIYVPKIGLADGVVKAMYYERI